MNFAAIFDWDGVIIDSSAQHERSWELLAAEINKPLPDGHFKRGFGKKNEVIIPDLGWATQPAEVHALGLRKEELYRELIRRDGATPLPGARELLEALEAAGVPCAVGSSTHRANIEAIFDMTGLRKFFRAVVTGEDVTHGSRHRMSFSWPRSASVRRPRAAWFSKTRWSGSRRRMLVE